jgi:hypothetical protein
MLSLCSVGEMNALKYALRSPPCSVPLPFLSCAFLWNQFEKTAICVFEEKEILFSLRVRENVLGSLPKAQHFWHFQNRKS